MRIDLVVDDMCRHHSAQNLLQLVTVRHDVIGPDRVEIARVDGERHVRVRYRETMAGEMLADRAHARFAQATHQGMREFRGNRRIAMEGTVANDTALAKIEIQHGRKTEVDAMRQQFGGEYETGILRSRLCLLAAEFLPQLAKFAHRRQTRETTAKTLHAPSLVID